MLSNAIYLPSYPAVILCQTNRAFKSSAHSLMLMIALFVKPKQLARDVPQFGVLSQWLSANLNERKQFHKSTKSKTFKKWPFSLSFSSFFFFFFILCSEGLEIEFSKWKPSLGHLFLFGEFLVSWMTEGIITVFLTFLWYKSFPSICYLGEMAERKRKKRGENKGRELSDVGEQKERREGHFPKT